MNKRTKLDKSQFDDVLISIAQMMG